MHIGKTYENRAPNTEPIFEKTKAINLLAKISRFKSKRRALLVPSPGTSSTDPVLHLRDAFAPSEVSRTGLEAISRGMDINDMEEISSKI
jgi:hypothetical protein